MRMKLSVQFQGEEGIDAGGVSREWYQVTVMHPWLHASLSSRAQDRRHTLGCHCGIHYGCQSMNYHSCSH